MQAKFTVNTPNTEFSSTDPHERIFFYFIFLKIICFVCFAIKTTQILFYFLFFMQQMYIAHWCSNFILHSILLLLFVITKTMLFFSPGKLTTKITKKNIGRETKIMFTNLITFSQSVDDNCFICVLTIHTQSLSLFTCTTCEFVTKIVTKHPYSSITLFLYSQRWNTQVFFYFFFFYGKHGLRCLCDETFV